MTDETTVVKVQRALFPNGAPALVYDRDHTLSTTMKLPNSAIRQLGDDMKGYFRATRVVDTWIIGQRVDAESW